MKVIIGEYSSEVFPTNEDVQDICKVGQGADTCMFLTMGSTGWQCVALDWRMRSWLSLRLLKWEQVGRDAILSITSIHKEGREKKYF